MKLIAEKIDIAITENSTERLKTIYEVKPNETIEHLFAKMNISDKISWQYNHCEVIIRMVQQ